MPTTLGFRPDHSYIDESYRAQTNRQVGIFHSFSRNSRLFQDPSSVFYLVSCSKSSVGELGFGSSRDDLGPLLPQGRRVVAIWLGTPMSHNHRVRDCVYVSSGIFGE